MSRYKIAASMLSEFKGQEMHLNALRSLIIRNIASDPKIVDSYLKVMASQGLILEFEPFMYRVLSPQ